MLEERWAPVGIHLPDSSPNPEVIAAVIRLTRGSFRLLVRLQTQMGRVLAINGLQTLSVDVVETARENWSSGKPEPTLVLDLNAEYLAQEFAT
jgi:hypothetical protein